MVFTRGFTVDVSQQLKDAGAVTASGAAQVGGSGQILDMGEGNLEGNVAIDVSALKISANDESYDLVLQGSPDADFATAGNIVELGALHLGAKETKRTDSDKDDTVGRHWMPFRNERLGTAYRYLRLYHVIGGTSPSIDYTAYLAK